MAYLLASLFLLLPVVVLAGSSSVNVSRIALSGTPGRVETVAMRITNTDTVMQRYELSAALAIADRASMNPARFTLAPGESRDAVLRFSMPQSSLKTHITIVSTDFRGQSQFKVAGGIKIPVMLSPSQVAGVSITNETLVASRLPLPSPLQVAVYAIDALLIIVAGRLMRRRKMPNRGAGYQISFI